MRLFGVLFFLLVGSIAVAKESPYIDLTGIDEERRALFDDISTERLSPCGDPETLADSFSKEKPCLVAVSYGRILARLLRSGFSRDHIDRFLDKIYDNNKKQLAQINVTDRPSRGPDDAVVTIIEFADYECSYCGRLEPILQKLLEKHSKITRHYFLNFPLTQLHQKADAAARAALAAKRQGKFWEMHDLLYERQSSLAPEKLPEWAKELGLNVEQFTKDMTSPEVDKELGEDLDQALKDLRLDGTPSLFFNGRRYIEAQTEEALENAILLAYAEATGDTSSFLIDPGTEVRKQTRIARANFVFFVSMAAQAMLFAVIAGLIWARNKKNNPDTTKAPVVGLAIVSALIAVLGLISNIIIDRDLTQSYGPGDPWASSWLISWVGAVMLGSVLGFLLQRILTKKK